MLNPFRRIPLPLRWASLLAVPGLLILAAALTGPAGPVDRIVRAAFAPFCHQLPERSLHWNGSSIVVCARCAGFYAGLALTGVLAAPIWWLRRSARLDRPVLILLVPLVVDGLGNLLGLWSTPSFLRALTGAMAALPPVLLLMRTPDAAH